MLIVEYQLRGNKARYQAIGEALRITQFTILVPVVGHIIETLMILEDDHSPAGKLLWLAVVWLLFSVVGPLLYLLFGQRRHHVAFGQAS
jgi:O-antigen/teichoic acid export membrane protein